MKLSKESIAGILEKERRTNPKVHYISDMTKANDFAEVIKIFNGRSIMAYGIEEIHEITAASNSLVIGLETLDNGKILAMERALRIAKKRRVPVLLDLTSVNLSLYRKNTALSFLNRYTIDLVKGTVEEVQSLIRSQKRGRCKENIKAEYRNFAIKNKIFLLVESSEYYITDGYSEFYIQNNSVNSNEKIGLGYIFTALLSIAMGGVDNRNEEMLAILIASMTFSIVCSLDENKINENYKCGFLKLKELFLDVHEYAYSNKIKGY
ncbi:MAG: hydroxyethylthiazole kinase, partial [Clostridium sp.]|nr:hydroxyethylthiazole kinase [Clostridium sp.]